MGTPTQISLGDLNLVKLSPFAIPFGVKSERPSRRRREALVNRVAIAMRTRCFRLNTDAMPPSAPSGVDRIKRNDRARMGYAMAWKRGWNQAHPSLGERTSNGLPTSP